PAAAGAAVPDPAAAAAAPVVAPKRKRPAQGGGSSAGGCEIGSILLTCRGVDMTASAAAANSQLAYSLEQALKKQSDVFDPAGTTLSGNLATDEGKFTFT